MIFVLYSMNLFNSGLPHVLEVLEEKKMFLKFEITESVLELQKTPYISEKNAVFQAFIKDSHIFYNFP